MSVKLKIDVKAIPPGPAGNSNCRLILAGPLWDEWDHTFCVHGEKLRWSCDACDEYFEAKPNHKAAALARQQNPT